MSNGYVNYESKTTSGGTGFWLWIVFLSLPVLWAVYWGALSLFSSEDYSALGNRTPWGLYISGYAFLVVSCSIGACLIGSLGSVFQMERFVILEKRAVFLAVTSLVTGMSLMLVELGQPLNMIRGYIDTPNPASPIFGMGVIYTMDLVLISSEFVLLMTNSLLVARRIGILALFTAIAAGSTVGSVFGLPATKPYWNGPYLPIDFILCAWITGFAMMIIVAYAAAKRDAVNRPQYLALIDSMGKWLAIFLVVDCFFILWTVSTGMYGGGGGGEKYLATMALVSGPLQVTFWGGEILVGLVAPLALLLLPGWKQSGTPCVAAIMVVIGMFANKVNMLLAPQTIPTPLFGLDAYRIVIPSMVEISIVGGAIAFIILAYSLVDRFELLTHEAEVHAATT